MTDITAPRYQLSKVIYKADDERVIFAVPGKLTTDKPFRVTWQSCREGVQKSTRHNKAFLVRHNNIDHMIKFITWIEDRLGLMSDQVLRWEDTDSPDVKVVRLSAWWHVPIRRSFLTAAMRDAKWWNEETGEINWPSCTYLGPTKEATLRFLAGYTTYKGKHGQWCNAFAGCSYGVYGRVGVPHNTGEYAAKMLISEDSGWNCML